MNSDSPKTPREEMEAWLTSLLLGELSEGEAAAVRELMKHDAGLAKLYDQLKETISLVRETVPQMEAPTAPVEPLKISAERRKKLLTAFMIPPLKERDVKPRPQLRPTLVGGLVVVVIIGVLLAISFPMVSTFSRRDSGFVTSLSQVDVLESGRAATELLRTDASALGSTNIHSLSVDVVNLSPTTLQPARPLAAVRAGIDSSESANPVRSERRGNDARIVEHRGQMAPTDSLLDFSPAGAPPPRNPGVQIVLPPATESFGASKGTEVTLGQNLQWGDTGRAGGWDNNGNAQTTDGTSLFARDPEWVGALEKPDPQRSENAFLGRYAYIVPNEGKGVSPSAGLQMDNLSVGETLSQPLTAVPEQDAFRKRSGVSAANSASGGMGGGGAGGGGLPAGGAVISPLPNAGQAAAGDSAVALLVPSTITVSSAPALQTPPPPSATVAAPVDALGEKATVLGDLPTLGKAFRSESRASETAGRGPTSPARDKSGADATHTFGVNVNADGLGRSDSPQQQKLGDVRLADGSVQQLSRSKLQETLRNSGGALPDGGRAAAEPPVVGFDVQDFAKMPATPEGRVAATDENGVQLQRGASIVLPQVEQEIAGVPGFETARAETLARGRVLPARPLRGSESEIAGKPTSAVPPAQAAGRLLAEERLNDTAGDRNVSRMPSDAARQVPADKKEKADVMTQVTDSRVLLEAGKLDDAEAKLRDAIKADPENRAANYYFELAKEQRAAKGERGLERDSKKVVAEVAQGPATPGQIPRATGGANPYATTNLIFTGKGRQTILSKLERIRLKPEAFQNLGLGEVLRYLSDEAKKHDPEKKGINLLVSPPVSLVVDPATGLPVAPALASVDINTVAINLNLKGGDIRLADLLDAIVKGADQPLKYSIEDYAVVFSPTDPPDAAERLLTRTYKIDPTKFHQALESAVPVFVTRTNSPEERQTAVRAFFGTLGFDLDPAKGKATHWDDRAGTLLVRGTPNELEVIESRVLGGITDVEQEVPSIPRPSTNASIPQPEIQTGENNFSTFSLNVSDVSFKLAAASLEKGQMPDAASVRSEEFINAFDYRDPEPAPGAPIAFAWERARYPFAHNRDLLRFSLETAAAGRQAGRPLNIVLLLDNSGSMERADRVRIIREALRVLAGQLQPQDKLSVITFARTPRLWVDGTSGDKAGEVAEQVSGIAPQGGTNLEEAMNLAYQTALRHYLAGGINRVVLLTDGAANLGNVEPESLKQKVEMHRKQGVALDCFGIGWEGFNDDLLEILSRNGDGRYGFINSAEEAATEFAGQLAGALKVAASDVKVQVEFNPKRVTSYRQIGYAKHQLTKEQFRDNTVDAAEIAAQEAGNALYTVEANPAGEGPICTVRVRFRFAGTWEYREQAWDVPYSGNALGLEQSSPAMRLAASASAFAEWLVASPFATEVTPDRVLGVLSGVPEVYGADARPKKLEWMIRQAKSIGGK